MSLNIDWSKIFGYILDLGSILGILAFLYQLYSNRRHAPSFKFSFEHSHAGFFDENDMKFCDYHFYGILRNTSMSANSIVRLYLTVWENKKKGTVERLGNNVQEIKEYNTSEKIFLPLRFEGKDAKRVKIIFRFPLTGTQDMEIMNRANRPTWKKHANYGYEFLIEDTNGNFFDSSNAIVSLDVINKWWTLVNYKKMRIRYSIELLHIGYLYIKWISNKIARFLGIYR